MSLLNLGAGASNWVGPAIVWLFWERFGVGVVMWIYAGMYVVSAVLAMFLTLLKEPVAGGCMTLVAGSILGRRACFRCLIASAAGWARARLTIPFSAARAIRDYVAQRHADHMQALVAAAEQAILAAKIDGRQIAALGIDTTGSTVVPVDERLQPLDDYYLWCDHRGWRRRKVITQAARGGAGWRA